jgi:type I restriction enzyme S subunit
MSNEWPTLTIKEFCEFKYGKNLPADTRIDGPYPVYGSSSIASYHEDYLIEGPGLIIGRKGTVGKIQLSKSNYFPIDTTFYVDKSCTKENIYFLYYFFQLCGFEEMNSDAAVPGLSRNAAINLKVKLPPQEIQKKIASVLKAYDDLIEKNLRLSKLLEEMAQITYEEWFVRMKFPGHETAIFDKETGLPEGWEKLKIGDEIFVGRGSSPRPISDQVYFDKGDIPWLKIADATASHIYVHKTKLYVNEYGASYSRKRPAGSIVVAASGTLGFPMFLATEACVHDGWLYFDNIPENMTEYFYFTFFYLKEYFERIAYGAAIQNINTGIVKGAPLIMPKTELLQLFSEKSGKIMDTILNLQKQNILLKEARDILLPRLMTGMIDIEQVELPEAMLKRLEQQEDELAIA